MIISNSIKTRPFCGIAVIDNRLV